MFFAWTILILWPSLVVDAQSSKFDSDLRVNPDQLVQRGIVLLGSPYSHGILRPYSFDVPISDSESERLKLAVASFQSALLQQKGLKSFSKQEVRGYLGQSLCKLGGLAMLKQSSDIDQKVNSDSEVFFGACFVEYETLLSGRVSNLTASYAENYVEGLIASRRYTLALKKIAELRRLSVSGRRFAVTYLIKLEGDVKFDLGEKSAAGILYEKWLRQKPDFYGVSHQLKQRFDLLSRETGHPALDH